MLMSALEEITLNPAMGRYLDMVTNTRLNPNENYAREILQLFSVGTDLLNLDGTVQRDGNGIPIPTYQQAEVDGFAKIFTGWTFAPPQPAYAGIVNYQDPMVPGPANTHDTTQKLLLNGSVQPASQTIQNDMAAAIDNIFNHPNVGPFVSRHLIQNLVTSNPSPAYVARVATVFNNNGAGVRGDLEAVARAILLDAEARNDAPSNAEFGRLREPALYFTGVLRAFNARSFSGAANSDGYLNPQVSTMGQDVYRPPTVFSYYPPDYIVPGSGGWLGPEFGIISTSTVMERANSVNTLLNGIPTSTPNGPSGTALDVSSLQALAANPAALVDELNRLLLHGTMSTEMRDALITSVAAIASANRARHAVYLVVTSQQYQVQR